MENFNDLGLNENILSAITKLGFEKPTPIQEKVIPEILQTEHDIIALAQTGTGKTAAFGLPLIEKINLQSKETQLLVLCPTRELCMQITKDLETFSLNTKNLYITAVYGGTNIVNQITDLKRGSQIVVGTPGRVLDLIKRKSLKIEKIKWLVLDEADEMLNMGFKDELDGILGTTPAEKRNFLFSATMPNEIREIATNYMHTPVEISVGTKNSAADNVQHEYYIVKIKDRYSALKRIVDMHPNIYGIIFCRTRMETKEVADNLMVDGYNSDALHGDLSQAQRDHVMSRFRSGQLQMLVATDVAARGIDVNDLTHIINYNLPDDPEVYIHRSGRTGRAGKSGISISILHTREVSRVRTLEKVTKKKFERKLIPIGREICERQLFNLIDKIENIQVDEKQIAQYLSVIYKKLEDFTREELIKRFVSVEFNRFLLYYKDSVDINSVEKKENNLNEVYERRDRNRSKRDKNDFFESNERKNRNRNRDDQTWERKDRIILKTDKVSDKKLERNSDKKLERNLDKNLDKKKERDSEKSFDKDSKRAPRIANSNYSRFYINLGSKNDINPGKLLDIINQHAQDKSIEIGKIDILKKFSFFEVDKKFEKEILKAFENKKYQDNNLLVEVAEAKTR